MSSLIFASARCGDLPELRLIRKLFEDRYGQRFAMVALDLLSGNLVNRQVVNLFFHFFVVIIEGFFLLINASKNYR